MVNSTQVAITGASLGSNSGGSTSVSLTVQNSGSSSVQLKDVILEGKRHVEVAAPLEAQVGINESVVSSIDSNLGVGAGLGIGAGVHVPPQLPPALVVGSYGVGGYGNAQVSDNASAGWQANGSANAGASSDTMANTSAEGSASPVFVASGDAGERARVIANIRNVIDLGFVPFVVNSDGSLSLVTGEGQLVGASGYTLAPGATATLTFSGNVVVGDGSFVVSLVSHAPDRRHGSGPRWTERKRLRQAHHRPALFSARSREVRTEGCAAGRS